MPAPGCRFSQLSRQHRYVKRRVAFSLYNCVNRSPQGLSQAAYVPTRVVDQAVGVPVQAACKHTHPDQSQKALITVSNGRYPSIASIPETCTRDPRWQLNKRFLSNQRTMFPSIRACINALLPKNEILQAPLMIFRNAVCKATLCKS